MCWHVKAQVRRCLQSCPLSCAAFCVAVCVSGSHTLFFSQCVYSPIIFPVCVCVLITDSVVFSCKSRPPFPPPSPTERGILYHVSAVFRELSRKIKHRGLSAPPSTSTTPPKRPRHLPPSYLLLVSLTLSRWHFFIFSLFQLHFSNKSCHFNNILFVFKQII